MKLEIALTLDPFILTLSFEITKGGIHLTWSSFNALAEPTSGPNLAPREEAAA
jgi:hypothetical protein